MKTDNKKYQRQTVATTVTMIKQMVNKQTGPTAGFIGVAKGEQTWKCWHV